MLENPMSARKVVPMILALAAAACGSKGETKPAPAADKAPQPTASAATAIPHPEATVKAEPEKAAPAEPAAKIGVVLKNVQVFHPYASSHVLPSVTDDGSFDAVSGSGYDGPGKFGVGVVVEAENKGDEMLSDLSLTGSVVFEGKRGSVTCDLEASKIGYDGPRFVTLVPAKVGDGSGAAKWKTDADSEMEGSFRPAERARLYARNDRCETLVMNDLDVQKITGNVTITGRRRFSATAAHDLTDDAYDMSVDSHTVRIVDKKTGKVTVVGVGAVVDMDRRADDGAKLRRIRLFKPMHIGDADRVASEPLRFDLSPKSLGLQGIKLASGETGFVSGNLVIHAKDGAPVVEDLAKLGFSLDTFPQVELPAQSPAIEVKADELTAKVTSIALAHHSEDASIDKGKRRLTVKWSTAVAGAQIESRLGEKAQGAQGERALKSERSRVVKQLPCDEIKLVTNKTTRAPANKSEAAKACGSLEAVDGTEVTIHYDLDRYEIPVALSYPVGKTKTFSPIATPALVKFDAR